MTIELLKPGDPCPCCGQAITAEDEYTLMLLTCWRAAKEGDFLTAEYLAEILGGGIEDA